MKAKVVPEDFENEKHLYRKKVTNQEEERLKNHIFVRCNSIVRKVVAFAIDMMLNKKFPNVKLSAVSKNMDKVIFIVELIKRKVKGLGQQTSLDVLKYKEVYVPKSRKEGLTEVVINREATLLNVILDYRDTVDQEHYGYQRPLPLGMVSQKNPRDYVLMVINEFKKKSNRGSGGGYKQGNRRRNNQGRNHDRNRNNRNRERNRDNDRNRQREWDEHPRDTRRQGRDYDDREQGNGEWRRGNQGQRRNIGGKGKNYDRDRNSRRQGRD